MCLILHAYLSSEELVCDVAGFVLLTLTLCPDGAGSVCGSLLWMTVTTNQPFMGCGDSKYIDMAKIFYGDNLYGCKLFSN